jgi:hypothetical protein
LYAAVAAVGVTAFVFDGELNDISQQRSIHSEFNSDFFNTIEPLGLRKIYVAAIPIFVGHGLIFKDKKSMMVGGELFAGMQLANGITYLVKSGFGRKRPFESDSPFDFFEGGSSFYSGHVVNIFTFATILSKNYPKQDLSFIGVDRNLPLVPVISYSTAVLVGIQRLYGNTHWLSDVYFGALAGYGIGSLVMYLGNLVGERWLSIVPGDPPRVNLSFKLH